MDVNYYCPLAGMQYFDCISATSGSYSRRGEMDIFMCISAKLLQNLRSWECNILIASPQAELSIPDRIPTREE